MCKLESYGIQCPIYPWLQPFLTKRYMKVVVDGESSSKVSLDSGGQGPVLGPLLLLCHINDLPLAVNSKVRLFADDCLLYRRIKTQHDRIVLQNGLLELEKWATKWGTRLNAQGSYVMGDNCKSVHFDTNCNHILKQGEENPYLGSTLTENFKWSSHIIKITRKANSTLGFLRRNLRIFPMG